jgi:hypothetical protein
MPAAGFLGWLPAAGFLKADPSNKHETKESKYGERIENEGVCQCEEEH